MNEPMLSLLLTLGGAEVRMEKEGNFRILSASGLETGEFETDHTENAVLDGGRADGARMKSRRIVLEAEYVGSDPEGERYEMISLLRPGGAGTLHVDRGRGERVTSVLLTGAECTQENLYDPLRFRLSLLCPDPYFYAAEPVVLPLRERVPLLFSPVFSFAGDGLSGGLCGPVRAVPVVNPGDAPVGVVAELYAAGGDVTDPLIRNMGRVVTVPGVLHRGERLLLSTEPGQRRVEKNGEPFYGFDRQSEFFTLPCGLSLVTAAAAAGMTDLDGRITFRPKYYGA